MIKLLGNALTSIRDDADKDLPGVNKVFFTPIKRRSDIVLSRLMEHRKSIGNKCDQMNSQLTLVLPTNNIELILIKKRLNNLKDEMCALDLSIEEIRTEKKSSTALSHWSFSTSDRWFGKSTDEYEIFMEAQKMSFGLPYVFSIV